ncbi:hypothetical protein [Paraburkholderia bryophila]|jgi:hypothetical protein|uniref:Uncharacterized protein n=1 Tax=Paraburkholderia bryophila TaxID=420952 RepID=A0A329CTX1_9BURK|nr:hypothetical protein [Paraburkholderia bryophila]RAS37840.1 hypothetical protein BX591_102122 [Paraburkholderia bryophila]
MKSRTAKLAAAVVLVAAASALAAQAQAQTPPDSQWRATPTTLSTLLQNGYKIVAVVNSARGSAGVADTIFVQRDQSAFKCIDPQQPDAKTRTPVTPPACFELVPPAGAAPTSESK